MLYRHAYVHRRRRRRQASLPPALALSGLTRIRTRNPHPQTRCEAFVDPYIEHGTELLLVDLLLIKRSVYCHLLRNAETSASNKPFLKLAIIVFAAETCASGAPLIVASKADTYFLALMTTNILANADLTWSRQGEAFEGTSAGCACEAVPLTPRGVLFDSVADVLGPTK